jgi:hypothetical protein
MHIVWEFEVLLWEFEVNTRQPASGPNPDPVTLPIDLLNRFKFE